MASLDHITTLIQNRQFSQAKTALRKLTRQKSKLGIDWQRAMTLAGHLSEHDTMLAAARNWRSEAAGDPVRIITEITALGVTSNHEEAIKLSRVLQQNMSGSGAADGYSLEGFYQARFGKKDEALALCREALKRFPNHAAAWEQISSLNGFDDLSADILEMERVEQAVTSTDGRLAISYALMRAYDQKGNLEKAYEYVTKASQLRKGAQGFDVTQVTQYLMALQSVFTPEYIQRHEVIGSGDGLVFILSLPRSGSTLLEQILSTSDSILPTSEHAIMRSSTLKLGNLDPNTLAAANNFEDRDWAKMGKSYVADLRRRFGASPNYTDKTLTNYIYAGVIRILFPDAKLIWLTRDQRDVAWSCYRHRIQGAPWTDSLEATCRFIKAHTSICGYWQKLWGDQLIAITYEQLINEPDETTQKLFAHVGVERPDDWFDFHKNVNPVATNSLAQVREPLNEKGLSAWRRYEKFLAPTFDREL